MKDRPSGINGYFPKDRYKKSYHSVLKETVRAVASVGSRVFVTSDSFVMCCVLM
jgi:hypothetical protein